MTPTSPDSRPAPNNDGSPTPLLWVVINPKSGSFDGEFAEAVKAALSQTGLEFVWHETTLECSASELARRAVEAGVTQLVACGGDGTVMGAVNGLAASGKKADELPILSIVPGGTANLLAAALHLPDDPAEAVAVALGGQDKLIDLGRVEETFFALGVGVGLTEKLVSQTSVIEKRHLGKLAYLKAMLREVGARPVTFTFKLDEQRSQRVRGVAIVIANSGTVGGRIDFAPQALMDDGCLDLCVLHRFWVRDVLRLFWNSLRGHLPADRAVSFYQAQRIEVHSDPPLDSQVDGEIVELPTPLIAEVLPGALRVRVPHEEIEDVGQA